MCLYLHLPEKKKLASCFLIQVPKLHDLAWEQRGSFNLGSRAGLEI